MLMSARGVASNRDAVAMEASDEVGGPVAARRLESGLTTVSDWKVTLNAIMSEYTHVCRTPR